MAASVIKIKICFITYNFCKGFAAQQYAEDTHIRLDTLYLESFQFRSAHHSNTAWHIQVMESQDFQSVKEQRLLH